jgi:hypothetical protein
VSRKMSHQTHPLVYECKQICSDLLEGDEIVDERARHASCVIEWSVFERPILPVDFHLVRSVFLREWQGNWDATNTGRFTHFILPRFLFGLGLNFEGRGEDRKFVSTVSRIMSGYCTARLQLSRFRIV